MPHNRLKRLCLLAAAAITVVVATGCGPGGKLYNCSALGDRAGRGSPSRFHNYVSLVKLGQIQSVPQGEPGKGGC